jgi:hypothetical protein
MKIKSQDISLLHGLLKISGIVGAHQVIISPGHVLSTDELRMTVIENKILRFQEDSGIESSKCNYHLQGLADLLDTIEDKKMDIRPFCKFDRQHTDFIIDLGLLYKVFDRFAQMIHWDIARRAASSNPNPDTAIHMLRIIDIVNWNIKRLCDIPGVCVHANEWVKSSGFDGYQLPEKVRNFQFEKYTPFTLQDAIKIRERIALQYPQKSSKNTKRL